MTEVVVIRWVGVSPIMLLYMTLELLLEKKLSTLSILNYPNLKKFQYSVYVLLIRFWYILHDLTGYLRIS